MKVAVVGAGWAGMAAAVAATLKGHHATVFEASRAVGGRARALESTLPDGTPVTLDNGQHILIGAYSETLRLMRLVGMAPEKVLLRSPLNLLFSDGMGLALPRWPSPLDALGGMLMACGWSWSDKVSLLKAAIGWQLHGFTCPPHTTVADLCAPLTPRVRETLIDPLCVSALNTPASRASGQVFLRVLKDSLLADPAAPTCCCPLRIWEACFLKSPHLGSNLRAGRCAWVNGWMPFNGSPMGARGYGQSMANHSMPWCGPLHRLLRL